MTNEQALLALSKNRFDQISLAAIAANNTEQLGKAIFYWFGKVQCQSYISARVVQHVADNAKFFRPLNHKVDAWIHDCVDRGCRILRLRFGEWVA